VRNKLHTLFERTVRFYVQHFPVFVRNRGNKLGAAVVLTAFVNFQFYPVIAYSFFARAFVKYRRGLVVVIVDIAVVIFLVFTVVVHIVIAISAIGVAVAPVNIVIVNKTIASLTAVIMIFVAVLTNNDTVV
jgi:hypothetical protein